MASNLGFERVSMRGMAAFAGGAAAAVLFSRVLPPVMAKVAGMARAAVGRDPFDALVQDHRAILSLLNSLERTSRQARMHRLQLLLLLKRRLSAHALAEEDVIYPMLHELANEVNETRQLYSEHAEMKIHLHMLEQMPKDHPGWIGHVRELRNLIQDHIEKEEESDFPKLRQVLNSRSMMQLYGNMQREKALLL